MHRPATKELLLNVLKSDALNVTDRLRVGLTCKQAWDLALPLVWGEWLPLHVLFDLFPSDLFLETKAESVLSRLPTSEDFARLEYYKPHIRRICIGDEYRLKWKEDMLLQTSILSQYSGLARLFENVTQLSLDFRLAHLSQGQHSTRELYAGLLERHLDATRISHVYFILPGSKLSVKRHDETWANDSMTGLSRILDRVATFENLQYLSLSSDDDMQNTLTDRLVSMIPGFLHLKRLDIWPSLDAEHLLPSLSNLKHLEMLCIETSLMGPEEVSDPSVYSTAAFPALSHLSLSNPLTDPTALLTMISSTNVKSFSTLMIDESWPSRLATSISSKGWHSFLEYLHLAFLPGQWYSIRDFAVCSRLRFLSVTSGRIALSKAPLDMVTDEFKMLEGLFLDLGTEVGIIKADRRLELPINDFCEYVSRCPSLQYVHIPFSLDFPRGLVLDAELVVPQLEYLFAEGISCSDVPSAKAFISSMLPKLERVLATGIDNKAQETLDELEITFNFPDAETLYQLRLNLAQEEPSLRHQISQSIQRRAKKRYYRPRTVSPLPPPVFEVDRTEDNLSEERIVEIPPGDSPTTPNSPTIRISPSSPQTLLSASDTPNIMTRSSLSSTGDDMPSAPSIYDLD
ncbi:hypothetical protein CALCODRAFT_84058 [Calocera cornea HHB12733]|uniref:Uncharacterized protein n=1 Tax=Calocera cornea HHB12733 TaxID=1353952 RepID=A0A165ILX8_9BASI|nr:hypothetical protein CALCODRAFT_84058 [Calocera cornea HHB12733]